MKKEFYKLSIVFTMIVFAFALAFFLGREVTLSGQQQSKIKSPPSPHTSSLLPGNKASSEDFTDKQREKVNEYKKTLNQAGSSEKENHPHNNEKIDRSDQEMAPSELHSLPRRSLQKLQNMSPRKRGSNQINIKPPDAKKESQKPKEIYALFIASYKDKETATEQSTQLKLRFPKWKIFFKKANEVYKVYIGPFKSKETAENFLKELQKKTEFSSIKLEKI